MASTKVGILGYQGCIEPHETIFEKLGVPCLRVRTPDELASVDRLILPGGESTTMLRFIKLHSMVEPLKAFATKHPVWGICAGAILAASEVINPQQESLGLIDIAAHRNFYGSQLDSFTTHIATEVCQNPVEAHFIRAPLLTPLSDAHNRETPLRVLGSYNTQPVFFAQGLTWVCSFHVELGSDLSLHQAFIAQH